MLVKFLNSGDRVSTAIAGSYFKGDGWTGAYYDSAGGRLVFESEDGLGFTTGDLRVATGGTSSVEWTTVLNKPTSFPPSAHTHLWADITDKPTEFIPVSHNHTISQVTGLQSVIDAKADKSQILTQRQFRDSVAAMFQSGTHTNVSINYDPVAGTLNLSTPVEPPVEQPANYQRVVVIGASLEYSMYLNNLATPFATATNELGMGIPVYGCATSGARMRALIANVQQAVAAFPAVGETLFLVHPTGNDITSSLEYSQRSPAQLDALRLDLNDFLDAFGAHLPHVVPILSSFRSYTGRGYGAREIYNAQEKGSKPFNDNVFGPIYQARTRSRWRYADGGDMMCFYDMTRNDFETYLQADGIHFTWPGVTGIRAEQLRRLRLWLTGTPAAQIVPDPVDQSSPLIVTSASITPASGAVGTRFVLTPATFSGDPAPTVAGVLTLDGRNVTSQIAGGEYVSDAEGDLVYTSTGTNSHGATPSVAEARVQNAVSNRAIYLNFTPVALGLSGLNDIVIPQGTTPGLGPVALVDQDGAATGVTYQISKEGGSGLVSVGYNTGTWTINTTPWDGSTLFATEILDETWYVPYAPDPAPGQVPLHRFAGLVAGATYQIQIVASRQSATGRTCTFTYGGVSIALDPAAYPAVMGADSFVADASGVITLRQTITGTFGYICGLRLVRVS